MKKILSLMLSALLFCSFFTSCEEEEEEKYTFSGTVNIKIFNNADVPLIINKIEEGSGDSSYLSSIYGTMITETSVLAGFDKDFKIECKKISNLDNYFSVDASKFDCYYKKLLNSTVAYPYLGTITGDIVKKSYKFGSYYKSNEGILSHDRLKLSSGSTPEIYILLEFVKTTDGDYVLALVK